MSTTCLLTIVLFLVGAVCELFAALGEAQLGAFGLVPGGLAFLGAGLALAHVHRHP